MKETSLNGNTNVGGKLDSVYGRVLSEWEHEGWYEVGFSLWKKCIWTGTRMLVGGWIQFMEDTHQDGNTNVSEVGLSLWKKLV